ncbi:MAG: hypothetical protein NTY19_16955 [Planctomycetota bacterium]|nr:hypothetical protein [Planctomycetota bacterium]
MEVILNLTILLLMTVAAAVQDEPPGRSFPKIKTHHGAGGLHWIEIYCKEMGIGQIKPNTLRYFHQPWGIVAKAIEVDLTTGKMIVYPPTHDKGEKIVQQLTPQQLADLKSILRSPRFTSLPMENPVSGMDGYSILIESTLDEKYLWKLHWIPGEDFLKVSKEIVAILDAANPERRGGVRGRPDP